MGNWTVKGSVTGDNAE